MYELSIDLKQDGRETLYEQIYIYIRDEIRNGNLKSGTKLPSTRTLTNHLQVSRSTVQLAYDQLVSEGYIDARPYRGYYVAKLEGMYNVSFKTEKRPVQMDIGEQAEFDFSSRGIDLNSFPFNSWRKISRNVLVDDNKELFNHGDARGDYELRKTISDYLFQARGFVADPDNIIIGAGNEYLLMLLNQLLPSNSIYAMEELNYRQTYRILRSLNEKVCVIGQDKYGMSVGELIQSGGNVAYVMPSHQYPLGIVMPVKRREELLKWAYAGENNYIIEDDYDSEFRYKGRPIPALRGFDKYGKVIYIGTFSKSIAPAIRMSYMVLPEGLKKIYAEKAAFYSCTVSRIDQAVVCEFMQSGCYEKHLNKMRALYKRRHDVLMEELRPFEDKFEITGENAGIHVLLRSKENISERELIQKALDCGVRVYPLSENEIGSSCERYTVIIGFANTDEKKIKEGIVHLKKAWDI